MANIEGRLLKLSDVAGVNNEWAEESVSASIHAVPGVLVAVQKQSVLIPQQ